MGSKQEALDQAYEDYRQMQVLQGLSDGKTLVRGAGSPDAPIMVIGEAPGRDEEKTGQPFTGPAGQELQKLFARAALPWEFCYRANVVPWRPEGNRTPYPFEIQASAARLAQEITIVSPLIVITAGLAAWKGVTTGRMGAYPDARGNWFTWEPAGGGLRCDLLAIWHPSAILHASGKQRGQMREETVTALRSVMGADRA